jgi:hypothetical protein
MVEFSKPLPDVWHRWIDEVELYLAEPVFHAAMPGELALTIFRLSLIACARGDNPRDFANLLKGRPH